MYRIDMNKAFLRKETGFVKPVPLIQQIVVAQPPRNSALELGIFMLSIITENKEKKSGQIYSVSKLYLQLK